MLDELLARLAAAGQICPMPQPWNRLYRLLPDNPRLGGTFVVPAPLILAAWHCTDTSEKSERFQVHLRWAQEHGALQELIALMDEFKPEDWLLETGRPAHAPPDSETLRLSSQED